MFIKNEKENALPGPSNVGANAFGQGSLMAEARHLA
jgi:hypothetical protein